jgi:hypothetical protein
MLDLDFQVEGALPEPVAAVPLLLFKLRITEGTAAEARPSLIHSIALRCQIQIEPARRRYIAPEPARLFDLFGTPERWGQTLRPLLWTHASVIVRPFTGHTAVDLPVPCSYDFSVAATKYFDALEGGEIPLCFLFSGTIFYETEEAKLQVTQIPWDKEAYFRLPVVTWKALMNRHYSDSVWLCLRKDSFDRLSQYKSRCGLATWEQALETLLTNEKELAMP